MDGVFLKYIDEWLYELLIKSVDIMPIRLCKFIAFYYTDARVRKLYWNRLGVTMGENSFANLGLKVVTDGGIVAKGGSDVLIGKNVSIAPNVTFIVASGANNGQEINTIPYVRDKLTVSKNITVEDEVWIGANVTILPGMRIGCCSVIGAGAVVTTDVEPYSVYAGVPARKIRDLREQGNG